MSCSRSVLLAAAVLVVTLTAGCGRELRDPVSPLGSGAAGVERLSTATAGDAAPTVTILAPYPSHLIFQLVEPGCTITWAGSDPDGRIAFFKYRLIREDDPDFLIGRVNPDSLRRVSAPFTSWESVRAHVTSATFPDLEPNRQYLFVIVAVDKDGQSDATWSLDRNMLQLGVAFPGVVGPVITLYNDSFRYTYPGGGYLNDPSRYVDVAATAGEPVTIRWMANAFVGKWITGYRWGLDLTDLDRDGPRAGSGTPPDRWTALSLEDTSATVGPFRSGETHLLYVEARDSNGLRSLGIARIQVP